LKEHPAIDMKTGRVTWISQRFRDHEGVKLEIGSRLDGQGNGDLRIHAATPTDHRTTKVETYCGLEKFVTYAKRSRKAVNCVHCIAKGG